MKTLLGIIIGITTVIIWHTIGWPWIGSLLQDQPATPDGWAPKYRTWINGVEAT